MNIPGWFRYHFFIGLPPSPQGSTAKVDFICPQAFGRNVWTDIEMPSAMAMLRQQVVLDLNSSQDVAIEKLIKLGFHPGSVNDSLAKGCYEIGQQMQRIGKIPWIIGQWEVIFSLATSNQEMAAWYEKNKKCIIAIWPPLSGEYLTTRSMLFEARNIAKRYGLLHPVVIAHREHLARCAILAERIFGESNIILPKNLFPRDDEIRFDPDSKQPQTSSQKSWRRYEILARFHHMIHLWTA